MKYEKLTPAAVGDYLKSWNSFWAGEYGLGFGEFETRALYKARVFLTHDDVRLLLPDEYETGEKEIEARFHTPGCEAWKTQEDWYDQYLDGAFPWELGNSAEFAAVCADLVSQINAMRPEKPLPPLDVDKRGLRISDDSIRAVMEASKKLGWHGSTHDELREDVKHTAWLCYNGKGVWLDERESPRGIDAWVRKVGGELTAQEICNLAFSMSNPTTDWPFAKP
ncbi:MAG: hypothetical protein J6X53_03210 [Abditibacteriota bacterium]|nr:hypothetical protein [Abditibacteriota bacterium]